MFIERIICETKNRFICEGKIRFMWYIGRLKVTHRYQSFHLQPEAPDRMVFPFISEVGDTSCIHLNNNFQTDTKVLRRRGGLAEMENIATTKR